MIPAFFSFVVRDLQETIAKYSRRFFEDGGIAASICFSVNMATLKFDLEQRNPSPRDKCVHETWVGYDEVG